MCKTPRGLLKNVRNRQAQSDGSNTKGKEKANGNIELENYHPRNATANFPNSILGTPYTIIKYLVVLDRV